MWNLLKRLWNILIGKGNQVADALEDSVLMTENGIREYEGHLVDAKKAQTEIETQVMLNEGNKVKATDNIAEINEKIEAILDNVESKDITEDVGDKLCEELEEDLELEEDNLAESEANLVRLATESDEAKEVVKDLKNTIKKLKADLKSIKASSKVLDATEGLNKAKAGVEGANSPLETIKKAQEKMEDRKARNEATKKVADDNRSASDKADEILKKSKKKNSLQARKDARKAAQNNETAAE